MKQISYFKFLEKFPDFIDMDDDISVKLLLLKSIRKKYWRKKDGEIARLLPIRFNNINHVIKKEYYNIKFRKSKVAVLWYGQDQTNWNLWQYQKNVYKFMSKEEITNLKREILIENMLK